MKQFRSGRKDSEKMHGEEKIREFLLEAGLSSHEASIFSNLIPLLPADIEIRISGKQCRTGKTWLCNRLKELGLNAVDDWEQKIKDNRAFIGISLNKTITRKGQ